MLYFSDGNSVHYLSISPPSFIVSRANNSFSFCHCDVTGIPGRRFVPDSIYTKCMISTTSPFEVREKHMIHIHLLRSVKVTLSRIYTTGFCGVMFLKYMEDQKSRALNIQDSDDLLVISAEEYLDLGPLQR